MFGLTVLEFYGKAVPSLCAYCLVNLAKCSITDFLEDFVLATDGNFHYCICIYNVYYGKFGNLFQEFSYFYIRKKDKEIKIEYEYVGPIQKKNIFLTNKSPYIFL